MFADFANVSTQSEHHRAELLADAEKFRLARLVRKAARGRHRETPRSDTPEHGPAPRNDDAERRYAV